MAYSAKILEKLPAELLHTLNCGPFSASAANRPASQAALSARLPLGIAALDAELPDGGLPLGALVEIAVQGAAGLATSVGLAACRSAQAEVQRLGGDAAWCAFIDPACSLHAPGVRECGVRLDRLLVVRPSLEALARVSLKVVESQCFAVVVIDTMGVPGAELEVSLGAWPRIVRRLALALQGTRSAAILITDAAARRPLTLPVAQRIELCRSRAHKLMLQVAKDKRGRVSAPRAIALSPDIALSTDEVRGTRTSASSWTGPREQVVGRVS